MRKSTRNRRTEAARNRGLNAIARFRRGESKTLSHAARAAGTTVKFIQRSLSAALLQDRRKGRIRVKATDRYSAKVQILTSGGATTVTARGSRQRELAGQYRATYLRILQHKEPLSALEQYRGKKVGGRELLSDPAMLSTLAHAGAVGQLDRLYVSPDAAA